MTDENHIERPRPWLHRLTVLAVCLLWPLIWVGGLVTTYDAGMAVPDWPGTYGYNLFLYPLKTWLLGPFDLFIEHGHRLLGAVVGMVAIGMVAVAVISKHPRWIVLVAVSVLLAVISQGILGGVRVVLSDRTLAMIHGCCGPLVFAWCSSMAVMTSRFWRDATNCPGGSQACESEHPGDLRTRRPSKWQLGLVLTMVLTSYLQLVLGAQIRHIQPNTTPGQFAMLVAFHVMTAFLLWFLVVVGWLVIRRCGDLTLSRPSLGLIGLLTIQLALGLGTWVANYGWPQFLEGFPGSEGYLIHAKGFVDSIVVTAHVATGSLILAVSAMLCTRTIRLRWVRNPAMLTTAD